MHRRRLSQTMGPILLSGLLLGVAVYCFGPTRRAPPRAATNAGALDSTGNGIEAAPAEVSPFELEGTRIKVRKADGAFASDAEIVGSVLVARDAGGTRSAFRIDAIEVDPADASAEIALYTLSTKDPATGVWKNACTPDVHGVAKGFPIAGVWTATGQHVRVPGQFEMTCTGGAYGKCVRWGYKPWKSERMWDLHQACTRMVRADYCGDGIGHTRNGTPIDIYDAEGIQLDEPAPGMSFEAGWGTDGAVCVSKTRLLDLMTLDALRAACPSKLDGRLGGTCSEARARLDLRTLIMNKS